MDIEQQTRGTRIIFDEAQERRRILNALISIAETNEFNEIILPAIEPSDIYTDKAGAEVLGQMYIFPDKKGRLLCLRPEVTATIQLIADKYWRTQKDVKLWYFERCYRYERPQAGRYREFWQFGIEWINPSDTNARETLINLAEQMIGLRTNEFVTLPSVKRGLNYYTEDGFEIVCDELGAQKQVIGGGKYKQGIGFAIGFDRLMLLK